MTDDPYVWPGTAVLRNKLGIRDTAELERIERLFATQRAAAGVPTGDFDLDHLRAIHRHLFSRIYDWAGEIRTVEIAKGGHQFMFRQYIGNGMADVHRRIVAAGYFRGANLSGCAAQIGQILGDVNYVHPFREGNGRTQLVYLEQLCAAAGRRIILRRLDPESWIEASKRAHAADYGPMERLILAALE